MTVLLIVGIVIGALILLVVLFPEQYHTWEAFAESDLVGWLTHPHELDAAPDEIELMARLSVSPSPGRGEVEYFVFRFRVHPPHWSAKDGWMAGIAGSYETSGEPMPRGEHTFSRFEAYDLRTPEDHAVTIVQVLQPRNTPCPIERATLTPASRASPPPERSQESAALLERWRFFDSRGPDYSLPTQRCQVVGGLPPLRGTLYAALYPREDFRDLLDFNPPPYWLRRESCSCAVV